MKKKAAPSRSSALAVVWSNIALLLLPGERRNTPRGHHNYAFTPQHFRTRLDRIIMALSSLPLLQPVCAQKPAVHSKWVQQQCKRTDQQHQHRLHTIRCQASAAPQHPHAGSNVSSNATRRSLLAAAGVIAASFCVQQQQAAWSKAALLDLPACSGFKGDGPIK